MKSQKELIYHFRKSWDLEYIALEKKDLGFPALEEVMLKYNIHKSVDGEELGKAKMLYKDITINKIVHLWRSKRNTDGKVITIKMAFLNIDTNELECEIDLMKDKKFEGTNHRNRFLYN